MRTRIPVYAFNPKRDVKDVESGLAVNVDDMLRSGIVKDSSGDLSNNRIDDPNNVIGLVRDEFAAIDAQRAIKKFGRTNKEATQKAAEAAAEVAAPKPSE